MTKLIRHTNRVPLRNILRYFTILLAILFVSNNYSFGQLSAGDIAFVQYNADGTDDFSFVCLIDIPGSEQIKFTDNGWKDDDTWRTGEGIITWTAPGGGVSCGTVVTITTTPTATVGSVSEAGDLNFSATGDQVIAYQGASTMIAAVNNQGAAVWQTTAGNTNDSDIPTGLANTTDAIAITEIDNAKYTGTTTGTKAALLSAINTNANWSGSNTANQTFSGSFTVTDCGAVTPTQLTFTAIPNGCSDCQIPGGTFSVTVCATDASENVDVSYTETITISIASGPGTLSGTLSVDAVAGCVTFSDLTVDVAGTYTLTATETTGPPLTDGTSGNILVSTSCSGVVFINEIHYDNSGADADEGFEIAGPAGTDLSCFDVIFYNGSTGASYSTLTLSGTIDDEGCGYGAVWFAKASIQNDMDGLALINTNGCSGPCDNDDVVQFLSYEGSFTATDEVASGMTSTDIGVDQEGPVPASGNTIQLIGTGTVYSDFFWIDPAPFSKGDINTSQNFCPVTPTKLSFTSIPGNCREVGVNFSVTVCAMDGSDNIDPTYTGSITISKLTGSGALSGTVTKAATGGCATFADLSFNADDTYTLNATDGSLTDGTSAGIVISVSCSGSGLIINEFSNGPSGTSQEYVELLVVGPSCTNIDLSGFILDDNNGSCNDGFSTKQKESGVAVGYIEFDATNWTAVPVGSIILIYNQNDRNGAIPADDPTDANSDDVYILPANNASLLRCSSPPHTSGPSGDCTYSPCTPSSPGSWASLAMRNNGDAIQVRNPDETYFHGISYGTAFYNMTGGPDNLNLLVGSGAATSFYFSDTDYRTAANFSSGAAPGAAETPGAGNNPANDAYIASLKCGGVTCADGLQNGTETGVDCGGSCPDVCHCINGIKDGDETGVDCGGADCPACVSCP